jgi:hypothetical protein
MYRPFYWIVDCNIHLGFHILLCFVVGTSGDLQSVVSRLNLARNALTLLCVACGTLYLAFGCSNFLIHLGTYFHCVVFTVCPPVFYIAVVTVAGVSHNKQVVPITAITNVSPAPTRVSVEYSAQLVHSSLDHIQLQP